MKKNSVEECETAEDDASLTSPMHFYRLVRKLIDLNKAYCLSLSSQLESDDECTEAVSEHTVVADDADADTDENAGGPSSKHQSTGDHRKYSEQLTDQLIDESFDQLAKYDQFAVGLVDDLFTELLRENTAVHDYSSPLNIVIPDIVDGGGGGGDGGILRTDIVPTTTISTTSNSNPASNNSSTTNSSSTHNPNYGCYQLESARSGFLFRRHSADVEKILLRHNE